MLMQTERSTPKSRDLVDLALDRACSALLKSQHADGHFDGDIDQGTGATAQTLILESYLGVLEPAVAAEAVRWLIDRAQPEGGYLAYPDATFATLAETCCAYAALGVAGIAETDPRRARSRAWIDAHGGFAKADPITQSYLVMAGVMPARQLPPTRIEHVLVPGVEHHVVRTFMLFYGVTLAFIVPGLLHGLRGGKRGRLTRKAEQRIVDYLLNHQNPEGNWAGSQWVTAMALACLRALGVVTEHEAIQRGIASLRRLRRPTAAGLATISLDADVWNTAMALRALHRAGATGTWKQRAIDYLVASQSAIAAPADWTNARPGAPRSGGWAFEANNPLSSDADSTSMALVALSDFADQPKVAVSLARGLDWLLSMQHEAGGFGAFSRPVRVAEPGPLFMKQPEPPRGLVPLAKFFVRPPLEFVEFPTADLTSRVACALARAPRARVEAQLAKAVEFLHSHQLADGSWWGRWTTNYLAGTAFVLVGLASAGTLDEARVARALAFIESRQNADGGFGEVNESYADATLSGRGPSNAYLTGLVLQALCATGHGGSECAARTAAYLVKSQRPDGLWNEDQAVQSMAPPELFYKNWVNFQTAPIEGLAFYRDVLQRA